MLLLSALILHQLVPNLRHLGQSANAEHSSLGRARRIYLVNFNAIWSPTESPTWQPPPAKEDMVDPPSNSILLQLPAQTSTPVAAAQPIVGLQTATSKD